MFYPLFYVLFIAASLIIGSFLEYLFYRTEETKSSIFIGLLAGFVVVLFINAPLIYLTVHGKTRQTLSLFGQKRYEDKKTTNRLRLNYKENSLDKLFKD